VRLQPDARIPGRLDSHFLDYLQKIPLTNPPNEAPARIDEISTGLADLSLELACPVFAFLPSTRRVAA